MSERGSQSLTASLVAGGFVMGEGPRWREGRFWFSDIFDGHVYSVGDDGQLRLEVTIDRPSGLGWPPDGSLLIATLARTVDGQLAAAGLCGRVGDRRRSLPRCGGSGVGRLSPLLPR